MYLEIKVNGAKEAAGVMDEIVQRLNDREKFAETDLAKIISESFGRAFDSGGASQGESWAELAETTIKRNGEHRVLDLSGRLRSSLTDVRGGDTNVSFSGDTLEYGTNVYYAKWVANNRPFAKLADRDVKQIEKALRDFIVDVGS